MPQPAESFQPQPSAEDSFLDLLIEALDGLEEGVRGQFLRQFFRTVARIELSPSQSGEYWQRILERRRELSEKLGQRISLHTALLDVLASAKLLRVPVLMEYEELKRLQVNAATDPLTGLYNRRLFDEYCDKELTRAKRYGQYLAVAILDLHRLKEVNDRYGHLQGDRVLQLAAATLRKTLRASDFSFRIGGDEFALLLPQTDPEQAITLCRRVRAQYEADVRDLHLEVGVTLDFGAAVLPRDADQKSELLRIADERLYALKESARIPPRAAAAVPAPPPLVTPPPAPASAPISGPEVPAAAAPSREHRKWERVPLAETKAYAVLSDLGQETAKVIDLSYGGVALLFAQAENLPQRFSAVLHVPILPPVRVVLRKAYVQPAERGRTRMGCAFVS